MKRPLILTALAFLCTSCIVIKVYETPKTPGESPKLIQEKRQMIRSGLTVPFPEEGTEILFLGEDHPPLPLPIGKLTDSLQLHSDSLNVMVFKIDDDQSSPMKWISKDADGKQHHQIQLKMMDHQACALLAENCSAMDSLSCCAGKKQAAEKKIRLHLKEGPAEKNIFIFKSDADEDGLKPLIIIDGEIQADGFSIDSISPDNIERIDVIKGPAAEKRAGDKGKNGIIDITMKKE